MYGNFSTPQSDPLPLSRSPSFPCPAQFNNIWTMNWQNICINKFRIFEGLLARKSGKTNFQFPISHSHASPDNRRELIETSFHQIIASLSCPKFAGFVDSFLRFGVASLTLLKIMRVAELNAQMGHWSGQCFQILYRRRRVKMFRAFYCA